MEANKVVQALKVLQEAGRDDLIKEGVWEQAWVGLKRPKRSSAERVSAAVLACKSPDASPKKFKKFKAKSIAGRKVSASPEHECAEVEECHMVGLPAMSLVCESGARFPRRSGASLRQRVAAAGRGAVVVKAGQVEGWPLVRGARVCAKLQARLPQAAVSGCGQLRAFDVCGRCKTRACAQEGHAASPSRFRKRWGMLRA
ncbi:hypothetical protein NDU88_002596 [Pleurodeles waltl]|uniref:Uncharacterized protein n=1 Tax=Pleurodeles waltl TaxID=8319 RepID=A0AAV7WPY7_PLEWA|nr:hypothetical protein NDU88_002596 [Pleurodeles waltl]